MSIVKIDDRMKQVIHPSLLEFEDRVRSISLKGPTSIEEYELLDHFFRKVKILRDTSVLSDDELIIIRQWFNGSMETTETLQGHVCLKPHGYAGDFEIIDKIYHNESSPNGVYGNWDKFFQLGDASQAVRNRKAFFIEKLNELPKGAEVLNLASGPCRDLLEYTEQSSKHLKIDCVDIDKNAIAFGQGLVKGCDHLDVTFTCKNIFRFAPNKKYDLIWSAGLFDYFDDKIFAKLLQRLSPFVKKGGEMIIGNFNGGIDSIAYMEFGDWYLNYRSSDKLIELSEAVSCQKRAIEQEELGVNLFLKLRF